MRRKSNNSTKSQPRRTASVNKSDSQVIGHEEDEFTIEGLDNITALKMQLEITQGKTFRLMAEKKQLEGILKERDTDIDVKIRELASMGKLILDMDTEKNALNQKMIALDTQLNKTKETLFRSEQQNKLLAKNNKEIQESLITRFDELAHLAKLLEISERTLMAREGELEGLRKRVDKFKKSLSWKAAAPARMLSERLNKTKKSSNHDLHITLIQESGLFNIEWYQKKCPELSKLPLTPVEHYLSIGFKMGLNPSEQFNGNLYLERYPDVAQEGVNPLIHYILFGKDEGRNI